MDAIFRRGRDKVTPIALDAAIEALNSAKDTSSIRPAKSIFIAVGLVLATIRESLANRSEYVELGLSCADVCRALEQGTNRWQEDQLTQAVFKAIEQLETIAAEIQLNVIKVGKRSIITRPFHAKKDRGMIASWKLELNMILHALNIELATNTHAAPASRPVIRCNPLQQLHDLDKASPQFHQRLSDFIHGEEYRNLFSKLQSEDLASLSEYLDSVLIGISDHASPAFQEYLHELRRVCGSENVLPKSCILSGSLLVVDPPSASGRVSGGTFRGSKVQVRRIRFNPGGDSQQVKETFHRAVAVWKHLAHRNIVSLLGVTTDPLQLISVWRSDQDLTGYITNRPEADRLSLLSDVAEGLNYLHSCGVIHGNLKGQYILVDATGLAQITDIGFATGTQNVVSVHNDLADNEHHMLWAAPETLDIPGEYSMAGDVFSFAGVMIEAFTSTTPFGDKPYHPAISAIIDGQRPPRPTDPMLTEELWALVQRCWDQEAHRRPKALEVVRSFNIPAWKCLISRPLSADECIYQVTTLFSDSNETEAVKHLRGDDAQAFVDAIDKTLDTLAPRLQKKSLGVLRKICGQHSLLPKSAQIPHCYDQSGTPLYHGGYADVWKGELEGRHVAVKVLRVYSTSDFGKIMSRFYKEVVTWKSLCHPNILPLLGVTMGDFHFAMVSEWMINGNINEFVKANGDVDRFELLKDVTNGLLYMHGRSMVHGDLKGANILIDQSGHACLADFGLLTIISDPTNLAPSSSAPNGGTTRWMSPELLHPGLFGFKDSQQTKGSDCYALGMVILEVLSGQAPFASDKDYIVMRKVIDGERPERPGVIWFTDDLWRTLEQCWLPQPGDRPTAEVVLRCLGPLSATWQPPLPGQSYTNGIGTVADKSVQQPDIGIMDPTTLPAPTREDIVRDEEYGGGEDDEPHHYHQQEVVTPTRGLADDDMVGARNDSPGRQTLEEEVYKLGVKTGPGSAVGMHKTWEVAREDGDFDNEGDAQAAVTDSGMPGIPDTAARQGYPSLPPIPQSEAGGQMPGPQWIDQGYGNNVRRRMPPWQLIHQRVLNWADIWPMSGLDAALGSTTSGHQVDEISLSIWTTQTYKRYVRSLMADSPQGRVDRLFVPPNVADAISTAVFSGRHRDASMMLRGLWTPFGLEGIPRLLIVLARHGADSNHWVVHRFSLPDGHLTTYDTYPEQCLPDGRPLGWWFAIRIAWPDANHPSPDNLMQKMVRLHRPLQPGTDNSVAAAGIWRNLLMGSRAERSVNLERLRDLIHTDVKSLGRRKLMGKLSIE